MLKKALGLLALPAVLLCRPEALVAQPAEPLRLEPASGALLRTVAAGSAERFRVRLSAGDWIDVVVEQLGLDIAIRLFSPAGKLLADVDTATGTHGPERLCWIAETGGDFVVEVDSIEASAEAGSYAIAVSHPRASTAGDRIRVSAQQALARGYRLQREPSGPSLQEALASFRFALSVWAGEGDRYRMAIVLHAMAQVAGEQGEYANALSCFEEARTLRRAEGDLSGEAYTLTGMALLEQEIGQIPSALAHHETALSIERLLGDRRMEAEVLTNLGKLYDMAGDKAAAMKSYDQALPLALSTGNLGVEVRTLNRIGTLYESQGEKQKAIAFYRRALSRNAELGNKGFEAIISENVGRVYGSLGEPEKAIHYLTASLKDAREGGDKPSEAAILVDLGQAYAEMGDRARARDHFAQALPLLRAIQDPRFEAAALIGIGRAWVDESRWGDAVAPFQQALQVARTAGDPYREADALTLLGAARGRLDSREEAVRLLTAAIERRRSVHDRLGEAWSSYELARVFRGLGRDREAAALLDGSIRASESLRGSLNSTSVRASFFKGAQKYYGESIDLLMSQVGTDPSALRRAFEMSERARGRSFLDVLEQNRPGVARKLAPELLQQETALRRRLDAIAQRKLGGAAADMADLDREAEGLLLQIDALESEAKAQDPAYAALLHPEPLTLAEVQRDVLADGELLLEYWLGSEKSFLWAVTRRGISGFELPTSRVIEGLALELTSGLLDPGPEGRRSDAARQLATILLGPVQSQLGALRLIVVADGVLHYVPFGALLLNGAEPLVASHEIVAAPSASVIGLQRRERLPESPDELILVFADPVFEASDPRVRASSQAKPESIGEKFSAQSRDFATTDRSRLPFTRREALEIMKLAGGPGSKAALDFDANLEAATSPELGRYRFIHFATHGLLDTAHPELSGLLFSLVDTEGRDRPGFLSVGDVLALRLSADLVVLSACRTALGKEIRGEGLVGLTRAFLYAGAPSVVASLWRVDDAATAELMKRFYEGMLGAKKLRPAAALREAQLAVAKQKRWRDPYYWAAFVLQGEWN